jgi:RimJ/RimL family protein N-acetyltransferase
VIAGLPQDTAGVQGAPTPAEGTKDDLPLPSLPDGTPVRLRWLVGADRQVLQDMYAAWSQVSRRARFLAAPPHLTDETLDHLVDDVDQVDHVAIVLLAPAGDTGETPVGVGRMIRYAGDPATADIALGVADNWQGRGVGSALARALVAHRPAGVTRLVTVVAMDNEASLAILAGLGTVERVSADGIYEVTVTLTI